MLEGKRTLVTGAASGIGLEIATLFASKGASVVLADINLDQATAAAGAIGGSAVAVGCDVSIAKEVQLAVARATETFGGLDVLVNNAGIYRFGPILEQDEDDFDRVHAVNLRGIFLGLKYGGQALVRSGGGSIINLASIAGLGGLQLHGAYGSAKAGVIALTQTAALEMRDHHVRANAICPGMVQTPMLDVTAPLFEEMGASMDAMASLWQGRMGTPRDIANLAAFLASDESSLISGCAIPVDGGAAGKAF